MPPECGAFLKPPLASWSARLQGEDQSWRMQSQDTSSPLSAVYPIPPDLWQAQEWPLPLPLGHGQPSRRGRDQILRRRYVRVYQ